MKKIIILALIALGAGALIQHKTLTAQTNGKLSSSLVNQLAEARTMSLNNNGIDILVKLKSPARLGNALNNAKRIQSPLARKKYVHRALSTVAKRTQANLVSTLDQAGMTYERFYLVNMLLIKNVNRNQIMNIAKRNDVQKVYANRAVRMMPPRVRAERTSAVSTNNIDAIGATRAWSELKATGKGIVVAGQDTGIQWDHPAIVRQYRGTNTRTRSVNHNYNWFDAIREPIKGGSKCGYSSDKPCDDHAHGTHTIGTAIGFGGENRKIGVAPGAEWIGCRNMDAGVGRPQTYIKCFEFFFAPHALDKNGMDDGRPELAAHVINNSWGCPSSELCEGDVMLEILRNLKAAGIFVVVSAGNEGPRCKTIANTPAWHTAEAFSVGAYNHRNNKIASFSSRGPSAFDGGIGPNLAAPGVRVMSAVPGNKYQGLTWSGTSMAGPHVAGVVALMWSANPKLIGKVDLTAKILERTAVATPNSSCMPAGKTSAIPNNTFGYGRVDAFAAVKAAKALR